MTRLTQTQTELLQAAAATPSGLDDADRRTASALIKRGFAISLPQPEGGSRLLITDAGRGALTEPGPAPGATEVSTDLGPEVAQPEPAPAAVPRAAPKGKLGILVEMLRRPEGARIDQMSEATGWQVHSVRGAISGSLKKAQGLTVSSEKTEAGRVYRIVGEAAA